MADQADFPDIYVDESVATGGVGSQADPYSDFSEINWTTGGDNSVFDYYDGSPAASVTINLEKGETWREQLTIGASGTATYPIFVRATGTGASPIVSGADVLTGFVVDNGTVYKKTGVTTAPFSVVYDGVMLTWIEGGTTSVGASEWDWDSDVLYVNVGEDPDDGTLEASQRSYAISSGNEDYITVDGLTLQGGKWGNFIIGNNASAETVGIQNCTIEHSGVDGVDVYCDTSGDNLFVTDCIIRNNGGSGVNVQNDYPVSGGTVSGCTIFGNGVNSKARDQVHCGIMGDLANWIIFKNEVYSNTPLATGTGSYACHEIYNAKASGGKVIFYENEVYGSEMGNGIKSVGSADYYFNNVHGNLASGLQGTHNSVASLTTAYRFWNNILWENGVGNLGSGISLQDKGTGTYSAEINGNIFYKNGSSGGHELYLEDVCSSLDIHNNILFAEDGCRTLLSVNQTGTVSIDNNLHWRGDGDPAIYYNGGARSWATWQGYGFDVSGINDNPDMTNPGGEDFTLTADSPCIGAGDDTLGSPYNIALLPGSTWPSGVLTGDQDDY